MKKLSIFLMVISLSAAFLTACGGKSDADIQKEVQGRVRTSGVTVSSVKDGVVTLGGTVSTQAERDAAVAAARGEGVKEVKEVIQIRPPAAAPAMPVATPMMSPATSPMASPGRPGASPARR
ncbi:MAG: BON domain-containing protein [Acidobacteriota bacterium]|nr:BON domain-containing protein [Acidobacteriota bacterium]